MPFLPTAAGILVYAEVSCSVYSISPSMYILCSVSNIQNNVAADARAAESCIRRMSTLFLIVTPIKDHYMAFEADDDYTGTDMITQKFSMWLIGLWTYHLTLFYGA